MSNFIGKGNAFIWFSGVVEDRHDPLYAGRLRVRCLGYHTDSKSELPTVDLPWATVMLSTASPGISGIGHSPSFLLEGSWVWGYFRDEGYQEPIIVGSLPGKPIALGNTAIGFNDPNSRLDKDGNENGISVYPIHKNEVDTNRLAVNDPLIEAVSLTARKRDRITGVPTARFDGLNNITQMSDMDAIAAQEIGLIDPDYRGLRRYNGILLNNDADAIEALLYGSTFDDEEWSARALLIRKYSITPETDIQALLAEIRNTVRGIIANDTTDAELWNQPEIAYKALYPYNHVFESESGHIKEYDDTPLHERIFERHISGSSYEYTPNGDRIDIITNNHYTLTSKDNLCNIQGNSDITVNGRHKVYINKDGQNDNHYDIQIGPNANVNIQVDKGNLNVVTKTGQFNFDVGADFNVNVGGNYNLTVQGSENKTVEGTTTHNTTGATIIRGSTIDLNP